MNLVKYLPRVVRKHPVVSLALTVGMLAAPMIVAEIKKGHAKAKT